MAAFPTKALAATASAPLDEDFGIRYLIYEADAGEANQVEADVKDGATVTIHDSGAVIVAGAGCLSLDAHTVECPNIREAILRLGDLGDSASLAEGFALFALGVSVHGGAGSDALSSCMETAPGIVSPRRQAVRSPNRTTSEKGRLLCGGDLYGQGGDDILTGRSLHGGSGNDVLSGGDRNDRLEGGQGNDAITAAAGSDSIFPGAGDDVVDAGAGDDDLLYLDMPGPMTVNLRTGVAIGAGTDTITDVEGVTGSDRGDLLIGDENANSLGGLEGPDIIRGGPGADRLYGGAQTRHGADRLYGGPGNDLLRGENGNDLLDGGRGWDRLLGGPGFDLLRSRDGERDIVSGQRGFDRARVDRGLDDVRGVEKLI